jgi:tetratricopeptide (TPR) repeat protein
MPKDATGRNDPCPCGSGKKYKKCCRSQDQAGAPKAIESQPDAHVAGHEPASSGRRRIPEGLTAGQTRDYIERLEGWADAARDAVDSGRLHEAERLADRLIAEYPDQIDGYTVIAMVCVLQERWTQAVEGFDQAIAIALKHPNDYGEDFIEALRRDADHARAHSRQRDKNLGSSADESHARPRHP